MAGRDRWPCPSFVCRASSYEDTRIYRHGKRTSYIRGLRDVMENEEVRPERGICFFRFVSVVFSENMKKIRTFLIPGDFDVFFLKFPRD